MDVETKQYTQTDLSPPPLPPPPPPSSSTTTLRTIKNCAKFMRNLVTPSPPTEHLSYNDCLELRGETVITVLCCIVY